MGGRLAVVFALAFEAGGWRGWEGVRRIVLGCAGEAAAVRFRRILEGGFKVDGVILAGLAGGLVDKVKYGDVFGVDGGTISLSGLLPLARLVTVGEVVTDGLEKRELAKRTGAMLCDMETVHLARVCEDFGVLWCGVRCVSDGVGDGFGVPGGVFFSRESGEPSLRRVVMYLMRHPHVAKGFFFGLWRAWRARGRLCEELDRVVAFLGRGGVGG